MLKKLLAISTLQIFLFTLLDAQTGNFNIDEYKSFLSSHKDLNSGQLLELHSAGTFSNNIAAGPGGAL
ncbi:MAG TPA: hypothetical protein VMT35_17495, partial [Ignavibacteriaceae bacterium]|nr:hypothetical protein [Ignavibacteriaceae bacterium]